MFATEKITNLLSMAQRARMVASGNFAVEETMKKGKAELLIIAEDASEESQKNYVALAEKYHVEYFWMLTKEDLGHCLGKEYRAAAVLTDAGFAKAVRRLIDESI